MSFTTQIVRESLVNAAANVNSVFNLQVGIKVSAAGKESPLYANLSVPGLARNDADSLELLANLDEVTWKMPKGDKNAVRIFRTPTMTGVRAAIILCLFGRYSFPQSVIALGDDTIRQHISVISATWDKEAKDSVYHAHKKYFEPANVPNVNNRTDALNAAASA